jgi:hypothetical protein
MVAPACLVALYRRSAKGIGVLGNGIVSRHHAIANSVKHIAVYTSANFDNMVSVAATTPFLPTQSVS